MHSAPNRSAAVLAQDPSMSRKSRTMSRNLTLVALLAAATPTPVCRAGDVKGCGSGEVP
jgi:hypothetical protein